MERAPRRTLYTEKMNVSGDSWVKAYHVCPSEKADKIKCNLTAGGEVGPVADIGAPTEQQCLDQVANERFPGSPETKPRTVIEFGVNEAPNYFGSGGSVVAVFEIQAKYLRWGSGSEGGWCAYPKAPIKWVGVGAHL